MVLLDLFSGLGGFHKGLLKAGFKFKKTYFSEILPHAIANYKYNYPGAINLGSITNVRGTDLGRVNGITFGSPCQDFSIGGNREGLDGERSVLINEAIRLIDECRPDFYIWENVKGTFSSNDGADFWAIIQAFANLGGYRIEWQLLNTAWFLPQNREIIYLVGVSTEARKRGGDIFPITQASCVHNPTRKIKKEVGADNRTALTMQARGYQNWNGDYIKCGTHRTHLKDGATEGFRENKQGICPAIPARAREDGSGQPVIKIISNTKKGYESATVGDSVNYSQPTSKTKRARVGKQQAPTLDTKCQIATICQPIISPTRKKTYQNGRRIKDDGDPAFTLTASDCNGVVIDHEWFRRFTEIECERIQGYDDNYSKFGIYDGEVKEVPATARYFMLGNTVTVDVVEEVATKLLKVLK